jgi:hypothetical protein
MGLLYISNGYSQSRAQAPVPGQDSDSVSSFQLQIPSSKLKDVHQAPVGAIICGPPTLTVDKPAWVTVVTGAGDALPNISLLVNAEPCETNAKGQAVFRTPNQAAVSLCLKSQDGQEMAQLDYTLAPNGVLSRPSALQTIRSIIASNHSASCQLLYTPAVAQPGQKATILGTGFAGQPGSDKVIVDGTRADLVAGSESSLVVKIPDHLAPGSLKQIFVSTATGDSDSLEIDIASPQLEWATDPLVKQSELTGRLELSGSNLPAMVQVKNHDAQDFSLSLASSADSVLPSDSVLVMPGGDDNFQNLKANHHSRHRPQIDLTVLPDAPELAEDRAGTANQYGPQSIWRTLDYALLVKLRRRNLAVEELIRQNRLISHIQSSNQSEKLLAQERALSQRHIALATMIHAREAIFLSHGGTQTQIAQAIDDATGGAFYVLESQMRALYVVPDTPVIKQATAMVAPTRMRLFDQLPEPRFKLWPPPQEDTQKQIAPPTSAKPSNQVVTSTAK